MEPVLWIITILGAVSIATLGWVSYLLKSRKLTIPSEVKFKLELHAKDIEKAACERMEIAEKAAADRQKISERVAKLETNQENTSKGIERIEKKLETLNNNIITFLQQEITELKSNKDSKK